MSKDNPYWAVIEMNLDAFRRALKKLQSTPPSDIIQLLKSSEKLCIYSQAIEFYLGADLEDYEVNYLETFVKDFKVAAEAISKQVLPVLTDDVQVKEANLYVKYIGKRAQLLAREPIAA